MPDASPKPITINRWLVGLIAVACIGAAATIWVVDSPDNIWCGGFMRVGLLMGAIWVALPTKGRPAAWANVNFTTFAAMLVGVFVIVRYPRTTVPLLIAILIIGFVLRPRGRRRR